MRKDQLPKPETLNFAVLNRKFDTALIFSNFNRHDIDVRLQEALQDMKTLQKLIRAISEQRDRLEKIDFRNEVTLKRNVQGKNIKFILLVEKIPVLSAEYRAALGECITPRVLLKNQVWPGRSYKTAMEAAENAAAEYNAELNFVGFDENWGKRKNGATKDKASAT